MVKPEKASDKQFYIPEVWIQLFSQDSLQEIRQQQYATFLNAQNK